MADPESLDPDEINAERARVATAYMDCKRQKAELVTFIKTLVGQPAGAAIGAKVGK